MLLTLVFLLSGCDTRVLRFATYRIDRTQQADGVILSNIENNLKTIGFLRVPSDLNREFIVWNYPAKLARSYTKDEILFVSIYRPIELEGYFLTISVADERKNRNRGCSEAETIFQWLKAERDIEIWIWGESCIQSHDRVCFCSGV
jgi:hypothetical protein